MAHDTGHIAFNNHYLKDDVAVHRIATRTTPDNQHTDCQNTQAKLISDLTSTVFGMAPVRQREMLFCHLSLYLHSSTPVLERAARHLEFCESKSHSCWL